jgi:hypothetical protein
MENLHTPTIKRKFIGYNPNWVIANDIEDIFFGVNISSYFHKYDDIRAPMKERKKKICQINILSPVIRKLNLDD